MNDLDAVYRYHDGTKHHFHRFALSLGYLDWASQPNPFRTYRDAPQHPLSPRPDAPPSPIGGVLRHSLGLSAWKRYHTSHWSLRVNPSSGNLHPTEAYVISGSGVFHYAPDRHALERRCAFASDLPGECFLAALTSIHWREAWKYGERAFRYCQHDLGHAIAAVVIAAGHEGLTARLLPEWPQREIGALTGIDRDEDFADAEREEAGCLMVLGPSSLVLGPSSLLDAVRVGTWTGRASQLSEDHVQWTFIDEVARATEDRGRARPSTLRQAQGRPEPNGGTTSSGRTSPDNALALSPSKGEHYPRAVILQRRSALALDGRSSISADAFFSMLSRLLPSEAPPWTALWWTPRIHLALFVHRVDGVEPGLYLLPRDAQTVDRLRAACRREFSWTRVTTDLPLVALANGDCRRLSARVSCDQDIAADGFFSLGMVADFDASLQELGPSFYRHLFWESGVVGQVLYLEAEAAGARGTGIGCFYDDPVHDVLGLTDHAFQSLYHFTVGIPVEDTRLTTEPGYEWELT